MPTNSEHLQVFATSARTFATKNAKHIQIMKNKVIPQVLGMATILFAALAIYLDVEKGISVFKFVPIVVFGFIALLVVQGLLCSLYSGMIVPEVVLDKDALLKEALHPAEEEPLKDEEPLVENAPSTSQEHQVEPVAAPQQYSCLDHYEALQEEVARKEVERKKKVLDAVNEYVAHITAGYLSKKSLATLLQNIEKMACGEYGNYQPLRSDIEARQLKSPDLRHLAWNIGERLGVPRKERAAFILASFPHELGKATLAYLELNLRDLVPCHIRIDVPKKGDYRFEYQREAA